MNCWRQIDAPENDRPAVKMQSEKRQVRNPLTRLRNNGTMAWQK